MYTYNYNPYNYEQSGSLFTPSGDITVAATNSVTRGGNQNYNDYYYGYYWYYPYNYAYLYINAPLEASGAVTLSATNTVLDSVNRQGYGSWGYWEWVRHDDDGIPESGDEWDEQVWVDAYQPETQGEEYGDYYSYNYAQIDTYNTLDAGTDATLNATNSVTKSGTLTYDNIYDYSYNYAYLNTQGQITADNGTATLKARNIFDSSLLTQGCQYYEDDA